MPGSVQGQGVGATVYTVISSFLGSAAAGAWLGLVLMSLFGLYGSMALYEDLLAGMVATAIVTTLAILCGQTAGRLSGLQVILVALVTVLNVATVLYIFGDWICQVPPAGPAFTGCFIPAPLGGLSLLESILLLSPSMLAATLGGVVNIRSLLRSRSLQRIVN